MAPVEARTPEQDEMPEARLRAPVMGLEAEFVAYVDGERVVPETYWVDPGAFAELPPAGRVGRGRPLPTGGAVSFDEGVIEVATPVIELEPGAAARAVRSLWEQIGFVRAGLTAWGARTGHEARLAGFSTHYNVAFEAGPGIGDRSPAALARLLAYLLPLPVALLGGNRRSTGVGVRPRGNRIEVTFDFTPDPGLLIATAALVAGTVRGAMAWPSYAPEALDRNRLPVVAGMEPGKHTSRRGWLARDYHYARSPFTTPVDARAWETRDGRRLSLRALAREIAWAFRGAIRRVADPFSFRLLFGVLEGQSPSLLELPDRPAAYDDVGRACRWGQTLPELLARPVDGRWAVDPAAGYAEGGFDAHVAARERERALHLRRLAREARRRARGGAQPPALGPPPGTSPGTSPASTARPASGHGYRGSDRRLAAAGAWAADDDAEVDRRMRPRVLERRIRDHPGHAAVPFPDRHLTRSRYEQVFLRLVSGARLLIDGEAHSPIGMRGWYHAAFRRERDGTERILSIDDMLDREADWVPG